MWEALRATCIGQLCSQATKKEGSLPPPVPSIRNDTCLSSFVAMVSVWDGATSSWQRYGHTSLNGRVRLSSWLCKFTHIILWIIIWLVGTVIAVWLYSLDIHSHSQQWKSTLRASTGQVMHASYKASTFDVTMQLGDFLKALNNALRGPTYHVHESRVGHESSKVSSCQVGKTCQQQKNNSFERRSGQLLAAFPGLCNLI